MKTSTPKIAQRRMTATEWVRKLAWRHLIGIIAVVFALFPLVWMASAAFDPLGLVGAQKLIPAHPGLGNFRRLFGDADHPYGIWFRNSLLIAGVNAFLQVAIGASAAYALSRFRFKARKVTLLIILVVQMFPQLLAAVALFLMMAKIGESIPFLSLGSPYALIAIFAGGALGINAWMLKGFYDTIPTEIDESAKIDGASHAQIFVKIILPLARPIFAVIGLLSFIGTMNEYLLTSIILGGKQHSITLAVGLQQFIDGKYDQNWGPFAAGSLIASIPVVIVFQFLQRFIISGLTAGSTKG
ncbi:MAG: sugar ABC transporter permease [Candidatus Nanopelagicaceae bacterium]|nr:sugar ABC transporter permease [Candidatus Nanopelagicaceae bacterium]